MLKNDGYALLIGIDDYAAFDRSKNQDAGTSDLLGSRNDVRSFWRLCRSLGMKPENIRVLASPPLPLEDLPGAGPENVAPATAAELVAKVAWLAEKLGGPGRPTGLLTYSGHGDVTAEGLVLCPSDLLCGAGGALENAVSFRALNALIDRHGAGENLTVVLDTCHAGSAGAPDGRAARPLSLLGRATRAHAGAPIEEIHARVLSAARRDQVAYQSMLDGGFRGVFSWAVCAAMQQWQMTPDGGAVRLDVSYGKLVETTQRLLSALWFDQRPELHGPAGLAEVPVFHPGLTGHTGKTSERPNGRRLVQQIDPDLKGYTIYTLADQNSNQVARILVTNTADGSFAAATEYWNVPSLSALKDASSLTMTAENPGGSDWPRGGLTFSWSFHVPQGSWSSVSAPTGTKLVGRDANSNYVIYDPSNLTHSGTSWGGTMTWWTTGTALVDAGSSGFTMSSNSVPSGSWSSIVGTPSTT